jgi:tetratricopeptide (TPR) repeat protein
VILAVLVLFAPPTRANPLCPESFLSECQVAGADQGLDVGLTAHLDSSDEDTRDELSPQGTDDFEEPPVSARTCDDLPRLLEQADGRDRLRTCLLGIDHFLEMYQRDRDAPMHYWVGLGEERTMGQAYLAAFEAWAGVPDLEDEDIAYAANQVASFLDAAGLYAEAEPLLRRALAIGERTFGADHPKVAMHLNNLAILLFTTNRPAEAEPLMRRALATLEGSLGTDHSKVATVLNNLAGVLQATGRQGEADPLLRRALAIEEQHFGPDHPRVARRLHNLAGLCEDTNRPVEAESLNRQAWAIWDKSLGPEHPDTMRGLFALAQLLRDRGSHAEAAALYRRILELGEKLLERAEVPTPFISQAVATSHNNLAFHTHVPSKEWAEAEEHYQRSYDLFERLGMPVEIANVGLNLQTLFHLAGRAVDVGLVRDWTRILEEQNDPRAEKGHNLLQAVSIPAAMQRIGGKPQER